MAVLVGLLFMGGCVEKESIKCAANSDCVQGGIPGVCEAAPSGTMFCTFQDSSCPSGSRWGAAAGDGLASDCFEPATNGGPDGGAANFTIQVAPQRLMVRQGETAEVHVTVTRVGGAQEVVVTTEGLPQGVTSDPLTIAAAATEGTLVLHASTQSLQGEFMASKVVASAGGATDDAPLTILVAGKPGTLDRSFAAAGALQLGVGGATKGRGLTLQPDGKIVATGSSGGAQGLTIRLNQDGTPDNAFGLAGQVLTSVGADSGGVHLVDLADGRIIVGGSGKTASGKGVTLFAYLPQGNLDTSFGTEGTISNDPGLAVAEAHTLLASSTQLIAVGTVFALGGGGTSTTALRFSQTGQPDGTFSIAEAGAFARAAMLQDDGRLLIAGSQAGNFWIARYVDDSRDITWNGSGQVTTDMGAGNDEVYGLIVLPGGKILAVGISRDGSNNPGLSLVRYNANGSLDVSFGTNGKVLNVLSMDARGFNGVAIDAEGNIIFVGNAPGGQWMIARLLPSGGADPRFGSNGATIVQSPDLPASGSGATPYGVAIDTDGRIVVSGQAGPDNASVLAVIRLWP